MLSRFNFRAWDTRRCKMLRHAIPIPNCAHVYSYSGNLEPVTVRKDSRYVLMQSTGLCDKAGKELYEGDICQSLHVGGAYLSVVVWERNRLRLSFITESGGAEVAGIIRILGNRYEDPKLMVLPPPKLYTCPRVFCSEKTQRERTSTGGRCPHRKPHAHDDMCDKATPCCPACMPCTTVK